MIKPDMECPHDIPQPVFEGLKAYVFERQSLGGFLTSCLTNDFMNAVCRADAENLTAIREIAQFIYCELPNSCWGNMEKVRAWLDEEAPPNVVE